MARSRRRVGALKRPPGPCARRPRSSTDGHEHLEGARLDALAQPRPEQAAGQRPQGHRGREGQHHVAAGEVEERGGGRRSRRS